MCNEHTEIEGIVVSKPLQRSLSAENEVLVSSTAKKTSGPVSKVATAVGLIKV